MGQKDDKLQVLIITGLSGAGKSQAVNCLEDMGYYCVDNLPPALLLKFIELGLQSEGKVDKVALVTDARGGEFFSDLTQALEEMTSARIPYQILFLEASDQVLVRRFKESRRRHPLASGERLLDAIGMERKMLEELRGRANIIIDTSELSPRELKEKLLGLFSEDQSAEFTVNVVSFGYKWGIPLDSDIVMDVRFLANPFYNPDLRMLTGKDRAVEQFVLDAPVTKSFSRRFLNLLRFLIPYYIAEGKTTLAIAIGCTGGQHRSVVLAEYTGRQLKRLGYSAIVRHRDVAKYKLEE